MDGRKEGRKEKRKKEEITTLKGVVNALLALSIERVNDTHEKEKSKCIGFLFSCCNNV